MNGKLKLFGEALNERDNDLTEKWEHLHKRLWSIFGVNCFQPQRCPLKFHRSHFNNWGKGYSICGKSWKSIVYINDQLIN
jgi:hypothetical protein